ncbi:hypothetical protein [Nisaea sp.]|uniref:hypothetical protein n=2 Tax=Nisaea sp. TaxID=2024842 RepID=UPI003297B5C2
MMAVKFFETGEGDGVVVRSPKREGDIVVLPEAGDATDWHKYGAGETYSVRAMTPFKFRREVRREDGSIELEEYDLQPESILTRTGPFEHRVTNLTERGAVFCKRKHN